MDAKLRYFNTQKNFPSRTTPNPHPWGITFFFPYCFPLGCFRPDGGAKRPVKSQKVASVEAFYQVIFSTF